MTDEEMAEEYAEEYRKNFRYYRAWHGQVVDKSPSTIVDQSFKDGFLAGLKAGRPQWHKADEIQCYEDIPNDKNKLYVWVVNIAKFEKDRPIIEPRVGGCDELSYDIMAYHLIKWCEIPTFDKE